MQITSYVRVYEQPQRHHHMSAALVTVWAATLVFMTVLSVL